MSNPTRSDLLELLRLLGEAGLVMETPGYDVEVEPAHLAHHEAGHAMVARALGGSVELVSVTAELRTARIAHLDHEDPWLDEGARLERVEVVAKTLLGGPVAERRCAGCSRGWGGDIPSLTALLVSYPHPVKPRPGWIRDLVAATEILVTERWDDITALSRALVDRRALQRLEILEVLRRPRAG